MNAPSLQLRKNFDQALSQFPRAEVCPVREEDGHHRPCLRGAATCFGKANPWKSRRSFCCDSAAFRLLKYKRTAGCCQLCISAYLPQVWWRSWRHICHTINCRALQNIAFRIQLAPYTCQSYTRQGGKFVPCMFSAVLFTKPLLICKWLGAVCAPMPDWGI